MNHILYDLSGNLSYSDDISAFDDCLEFKPCDHCHEEVEAHLLSKDKFCPFCQAECDREEWENTIDVIIRSI